MLERAKSAPDERASFRLAFIIVASTNPAENSMDSSRLIRVRMDSLRSLPDRSDLLRTAFEKLDLIREAPLKLASSSLASSKSVPLQLVKGACNFAPEALRAVAPVRRAPVRSQLSSLESSSTAPVRLELASMAPVISTPVRWHFERSAFSRRAPFRFA